MLQFHVELRCSGSNVAHKVRRYLPLFVASKPRHVWLISDVDGVIPHVVNTKNKLIRLRRNFALFPAASWGIYNGGSL